jgi:DNA repair exonuclease SbcCD ATPase subunit
VNQEDAEAELNSIKVKQQKLQTERGGLIAEIKNIASQAAAYDGAKARIDKLQNEIKALKQGLASAQAKIKTLPTRKDLHEIAIALSDADKLGLATLTCESKEELTEWRGALQWLRDTESMLAKVRKLKSTDQRCPTCTQPLGSDRVKNITSELEEAVIHAENTAVTGLLKEIAPFLKGKLLLDGVTEMSVAINRVAQGLRVFDTAEETQEGLEALEAELQEALKVQAEKPGDPEKMKARVNEITKESTDLDVVSRKVTKVLSLLSALAAIPATKTADLESVLKTTWEQHQRYETKFYEAMEVKQTMDEAETSIRHLKKQRNDLKLKAEEHATIALTIKSYQDELIPYFTALRASKVRSRIGVLENVLPVYVNALATGQYLGAGLKFEVSDDLESVDLMLKPSRFGPWLTALQNSGGQRQRFMLALYAGLYEVSPRKANALFMDEPFSGMEGEGKLRFINHVLPLLQERCPGLESIFVISHDDEVLNAANDSFDSVWTADRDERGSAIHIGQRLAAVAGR